MIERKAVYYGRVELIPGVICDGYVLDNGTAVMSERGTADLLGIDQKALNRVRTTGVPKTLEPFIDKGLDVRTTSVEVVAKIACGMDTEIGIKLKQRLFGQVGAFVKPHTKPEIHWRETFSKVFKGLGLHCNYSVVGSYRVDFFVKLLDLVLECNGISHKYYNRQEEEKREKAITKRYALVRFHPEISLETLFNGILQAKVGTVVRLHDLENICR